MKIQIEIDNTGIAIDALNTAVAEMQVAGMNTYVSDLLALRDAIDSAAREQRKGRANDLCACGKHRHL